jgi:hypothetical protein
MAKGSDVMQSVCVRALIQFSAIWAFPQMTSPSLLVSRKPPLPGIIYSAFMFVDVENNTRGRKTHSFFGEHDGTRALPEIA